jgi:D-arabinose 1-dehydrogenase-like Zn-dependent alcohol dehydrogenase
MTRLRLHVVLSALDYVAQGKVKILAETYSLDDIPTAYENVAAGNVRAVIKTIKFQ